MADLRMIVAQAVAANRGKSQFAIADAVLTALTESGVILPELPEWAVQICLEPAVNGTWHASLIDPEGTDFPGHGPTIPAALVDALNGGDDGE